MDTIDQIFSPKFRVDNSPVLKGCMKSVWIVLTKVVQTW